MPYVVGDVGLRRSAGRPVWSVADEPELEALRSTVALFDGRLEAIASAALADDDGARPALVASAAVLYPDASLRPLAELYAHLTSRVARLAPLDRVGRAKPEIVVCLWDHLDVNALEALQRAALRRPLGLVVAETHAALRVRLLRSAAAAALAPPAGGEVSVSRSSQDAGSRAHGALVRLDTPTPDPLDPGELRARAIVLLTSFGVPSADALVAPARSLLEHLLGNPGVACVATSLGIAMPSAADAAAMAEALGAGARVGDALYRNPGLSREAHERCRMLLFGDPRTRPLRGAPRPPAAAPSSPLRRPARPGAWSRAARLSLFGELIANLAAPVDDDTLVERLDAPLWDRWTKLFQPPRPTRDPASCPGCGRPGRSFAAEWRQAGLFRVFTTCTRCGVFRDIEPGSELDRAPPRLRGTVVEIPDAVADARVVIRCQDEREVARRWTLPRGRGRQQSVAGAGLATINVIYLLDLEMAAWQVATKPLSPSPKPGSVAA